MKFRVEHTFHDISLADYEKLYFLGGSVNWGNIRGVLAHNIAGLRIFEEGSYRSPRVDAWGIDDLHMFEEANEALRALGDRPFFAVLQTSGNHRPYTIPDDNRGFRRIHHAQAELASAGFTSNDELDSFRFVDHSLGYFFSAARKERYFANTIFVMFGDHGYLGRAKSLTQAELDSGILRFHVPLIIVGPPSTCSPRVVDKVASEVDVLPTVASLAGVPYTNTTLGRDLFDPRFDQARYAFVMADHYNQPRIGIVSDNLFVRQSPDGSEQEIWDLAAGVARPQPDAATQAKAHEMAELSRGLYESARYLLYHNSAAAAGGGGTPSEAPTPK